MSTDIPTPAKIYDREIPARLKKAFSLLGEHDQCVAKQQNRSWAKKSLPTIMIIYSVLWTVCMLGYLGGIALH